MRNPGRRMATESNIDSKKRCRSSTGWSPPACSEAIGGGDAGRCRPLRSGSKDAAGGGGGGGEGAWLGGGPVTEEGVSGAAGTGGSLDGGGSCWPRGDAAGVRSGRGGGGRGASGIRPGPSAGSAAP